MSCAEPRRTYGGKPIALRRAERRAAFIDAGLTLFGEKGFVRSSIAEICDTANLARSQFYAEFGDRETLLISVYEQIQMQIRATIVDAMNRLPPTAPLSELAAVGIEAFFEYVGSDVRRMRICSDEMTGVSSRVDLYRTQRRQIWVDFFEMLVRRRLGDDYVPPGGYDVVAAVLAGAVKEAGQLWTSPTPRPPLSELLDVMSSVLVALVPAAEGSPSVSVDGRGEVQDASPN